MQHTRTWHVEVLLFEDDGHTKAAAVLRTDAGTELRHEAVARRNPDDTEVPEIGDELAASRALSGLTQDLFEASVADIEENVHQRSTWSLDSRRRVRSCPDRLNDSASASKVSRRVGSPSWP